MSRKKTYLLTGAFFSVMVGWIFVLISVLTPVSNHGWIDGLAIWTFFELGLMGQLIGLLLFVLSSNLSSGEHHHKAQVTFDGKLRWKEDSQTSQDQ